MCKIKQQFQGNPYLTAFVFIMVFAFVLWFAGVIFHDSWLGGGELQGSWKIGWVQMGVFYLGLDVPFSDFFEHLFATDKDPYYPVTGKIIYLPLAYFILFPFRYLDDSSIQALELYAQLHDKPVEGIYNGDLSSTVNLTFGILFIMFLVFLLFFALNALRKKYKLPVCSLIGVFTSSVMLFSIERGNLILLAAACVIFFVCFYDSENKTERILAAVALAIAAVLKVYPVLFGLLYLKNKQFKDAVFSAVCAALLASVPFLFLRGGFNNIFLLFENLKEYSRTMNFTLSEELNPANIVYRGLLPFAGEGKAYFYGHLARIIITALSVLSLALLFITKSKWTGITLLSISVLFVSDSSGFYCGLYLFPCILYFFATVKERPAAFNIFIFIVFLIVLKPYQIALPFAGGKTNVLISTFVLSVLWLALIVRCIAAYCRRVCAVRAR